MSNVDTSDTYWANEGKYQKMYNAAWKALIPASGEAEDGWPEALRAISRIGYDYYNNGFCNLWQGWEDVDDDGEDCMVYKMDPYYEDMVDYVGRHIPYEMYMDLDTFLHDAKGYGNWSNQAGIIDRIIDYIMEGIGEDGLLKEELVS